MESKKQYPGLEAFSPSKTFMFGIVFGIMALCTLGFLVMVGIQLDESEGDDYESARVVTGDTVAAPAAPAVPTPEAVPDIPKVDPKTDRIRGNKKAKISLVEYSDFQCPFCQKFHSTAQQIVDNYDEVNWVYRHNPLEQIHPTALALAEASECAGDQGKFWEYADAVFVNVGAGTPESYAKEVGLNTSKFEKCMTDGKYKEKVKKQQGDMFGKGTPFSIILGPNGEAFPINGALPYSAVEATIKKLL